MFSYAFRCLMLSHLTLQVCPSSRAALWASTGLSMTRPVRPEKSMATREFSDTLRCFPRRKCGGGRGGWWVGGGVESGVEGGTQGLKGEGVGEGRGGRQEVRGQTSQTQSLGRDKSCLHPGPLQSADVACAEKLGLSAQIKDQRVSLFRSKPDWLSAMFNGISGDDGSLDLTTDFLNRRGQHLVDIFAGFCHPIQ